MHTTRRRISCNRRSSRCCPRHRPLVACRSQRKWMRGRGGARERTIRRPIFCSRRCGRCWATASRSRAARSAPTACASTSACRAAPHSACVGPLPTSFAVSLPVCVAVQHSGMWPSPLRLQPASQHHAERTRRHSAVAYDRPIKAASAAACCTSVAGCAQRHGAAARLEEERKSARSYCTVLAAVPLDVHRWQTASRSPRKP